MVETKKQKKLRFVNASKNITQIQRSALQVNGQKKLKKLLTVPWGARTGDLQISDTLTL